MLADQTMEETDHENAVDDEDGEDEEDDEDEGFEDDLEGVRTRRQSDVDMD